MPIQLTPYPIFVYHAWLGAPIGGRRLAMAVCVALQYCKPCPAAEIIRNRRHTQAMAATIGARLGTLVSKPPGACVRVHQPLESQRLVHVELQANLPAVSQQRCLGGLRVLYGARPRQGGREQQPHNI